MFEYLKNVWPFRIYYLVLTERNYYKQRHEAVFDLLSERNAQVAKQREEIASLWKQKTELIETLSTRDGEILRLKEENKRLAESLYKSAEVSLPAKLAEGVIVNLEEKDVE